MTLDYVLFTFKCTDSFTLTANFNKNTASALSTSGFNNLSNLHTNFKELCDLKFKNI